MSAILHAYAPELHRFDRAVAVIAHPFGSLPDLNLLESRNALVGFMAATADPQGFVPSGEDPEMLLRRAYEKYSGRTYGNGPVMPVAWLSRMTEIARGTKEAPSVRTLAADLLVDSLDRMVVNRGVVPVPQSAPETIGELNAAIRSCAETVLRKRLLGTPVVQDFAEIAARTVTSIVFSGIAARLTRNPFLEEMRGFEVLLTVGILVLGKNTMMPPTPYAFRMYKLPEERELLKRETVMVYRPPAPKPEPEPAKSAEGTLLGIGARVPDLLEPQLALMARVTELGRGICDQEALKEPFRLWSSFMRHCVNGRAYPFDAVPQDVIISIVQSSTGHHPTHVEIHSPATEEFYHMGLLLEGLALQLAEGTVRYADPRKRPTIRNPFGPAMWSDPYEDERYVLGQQDHPSVLADRVLRDNLRAAISQHLLPGLDRSFQEAGLIHAPIRKILGATLHQTFFRLLYTALKGNGDGLARAARLVDLYLRGAIPLGTRMDPQGRYIVSVVAKS